MKTDPLKNAFVVGMLFAIMAVLFSPLQTALAAPLTGVPVTVTQPDGTVLHLFASGDEFFNWLHDGEGYLIIQDPKSGYYVYAELVGTDVVPTSYIVNTVNPAAVGLEPNPDLSAAKDEKLRVAERLELVHDGTQASDAPSTGTITNLVLFIRFSGETEFTNPLSHYTDMFDSAAPGVSSMRNYFLEASYTALTVGSNFYPTPAPNVVSYQDANPRDYYRPYNAVTNPIGYTDSTQKRIREHTLLRDAIAYVDGLGQFPAGSVIDADGDGTVDSLTFVISGGPDGWSDLLWPHQWSLTTYVVTINGKLVGDYAFQLDTILGTGVLAHEMFHVLGAPDLYHYVDDGIAPVGRWDVMEYTMDPPQHMGCYMKYKYGAWISTIPEITQPGTYTLNPVTSASGSCYQIASPYSTTEFFIVEYRVDAGTFESSLPATGLLVYRINTLETGNASGPPDEVYIFRPDGTLTVNGVINSANFSSTVGRTKISSTTNPTSFLSDGNPGGLNLCNIGASGATISFDYGNCGSGRFSPASHDFGGQDVGTSSAETTFTFTNSGAANLVLGTLATSSSQFVLANDHCSSQTIPASASCTFGVVFSPTSGGVKNGMVSIPTNEEFSPAVVSLTGTGTGLQAAPTFIVNSSLDTNDGGCYISPGGCSLREAISAASAGNTILFDSSLSGATIPLNATLALNKNLTIDASALPSRVILSGDSDQNGVGDLRLFTVSSGVAVTLKGLEFTKGYVASSGGAIYNSGSLTVINSVFTGNRTASTSGYWGGAIFSQGELSLQNSAFSDNYGYTGGAIGVSSSSPLTVTECTFSTNSSTSSGGAIYSTAPTLINRSTFTGNIGANGGAVRVYNATLDIANSTFSGNSTTGGTGGSGWGGALFVSGLTNVANSTFSGNLAYAGGGIAINSGMTLNLTNATLSANGALFGGGIANLGTLNYANTIIANSTSGGDCRLSGGAISGNTRNLVEDGGCSAALSGDPRLGALQNNGGATHTFALQQDSPAIDAGDNATCAAAPVSSLDQRGQARSDYQCDIGAFELKLADSDTVIKTVPGTGVYTFGPTMVKLEFNSTGGCLTGVAIQRYESNHPNATLPLQTGHWWKITPTGCASGFDVNLTLPVDFAPDVNDKVCRWDAAAVWDCALSSYTVSSLTRNGVTGFSDWTVGSNAGPTNIMLTRLHSSEAGKSHRLAVVLAASLLLSIGALFFSVHQSRRIAPITGHQD